MIRYISDPRSEAEIRARFEGGCRLGQTRRAVAVLVMREKHSGGGGHYRFRPQWVPYPAGGSGIQSACRAGRYGKESLRAVLDFAVNACGFHKLTTHRDRGQPRFARPAGIVRLSAGRHAARRLPFGGAVVRRLAVRAVGGGVSGRQIKISPGIDKLVGAALCSIFGPVR